MISYAMEGVLISSIGTALTEPIVFIGLLVGNHTFMLFLIKEMPFKYAQIS
jgi:ABC-type enterochelin transport system permease subunit